VAEETHDELVRDLALLGRTFAPPASSDRLATAVLDRIATLPAPDPDGGRVGLLQRVVRSIGDVVASRRRRVALVIAAVAIGLLATPPVRAAVADCFGFAGVIVERGTPPSASPSPPPEVAGGGTLAQAQEEVDFALSAPAALGAPDGVEVSADRRIVSMTWSGADGADGVVRLDQFDGRFDWAFAKAAPAVSFVSVGDTDGLWFEVPHEVVLIEPDGSRRTESARLAGHTLIWLAGDTTMRLEGDVALDRAVEIAESAEPAP
jgi:hypothetical protein